MSRRTTSKSSAGLLNHLHRRLAAIDQGHSTTGLFDKIAHETADLRLVFANQYPRSHLLGKQSRHRRGYYPGAVAEP